jgi:hypothetical protein
MAEGARAFVVLKRKQLQGSPLLPLSARQALAETISQRSLRFSSMNALNAGAGFEDARGA